MSTVPETCLFVGSYGPEDRPGIYAVGLDEAATGLHLRGSFAGVRNPSFLSLHPGGDHLYAVSETGRGSDGTHGAVHAFRLERAGATVDLVALNHRSTAGDHPCHLRIDGDGRWLAVANYGTGNVAVFPLLPDGVLGEMAAFVQHAGTGPNPNRQEGPHAHATIFTPDNRFLIVADLGIDQLVVYAFDADTGSLARHRAVLVNPGAGPRHLAFHPDGMHLFVVNELTSSVTWYRYDAPAGSIRELQTRSTVPSDAPENTAADIHLSHSGRHVYVSNRGHDSVAVFAFDPALGLDRIAIRSSGGGWPRGFGLAPGGRHLVAANRHSNEIVLLPLLAGGADIGEPVARAGVTQPSCITFA
jgi:6-phosphogluconolactonase